MKKVLAASLVAFLLFTSTFLFQTPKAQAFIECQQTHWVEEIGNFQASSNVSSQVYIYGLRDIHDNGYCGEVQTTHASQELSGSVCAAQWGDSNTWWSHFGSFSGCGGFHSEQSPVHGLSDGSWVTATTSTCYNGSCLISSRSWQAD